MLVTVLSLIPLARALFFFLSKKPALERKLMLVKISYVTYVAVLNTENHTVSIRGLLKDTFKT